MDRPITQPPPPGRTAEFARAFGLRSLLTVDTEEEFDWGKPFSATGHSLSHVPRLRKFQQFCEGLGVSPVYLVDWPVATSKVAIEIIGEAVDAGKAEVGIQLHPWVNPPHGEDVTTYNSFAGNLPADLERAKFLRLRDAIEENFGTPPQIYRAGRYGLGPDSARMLIESGVAIDSSVRARFDYSHGHGPDYRHHPVQPYWVDTERRLLELPLTTVFGGGLRRQGNRLFPIVEKLPALRGALARLGLLERIAMTPEGVSAREARRGIDSALEEGLPLIVLSFHSPSLMPMQTPYVRSEGDLDGLYDWWREIYAYLGQHDVKPTTVAQIMECVVV